jgi:hypothetical protein
MRGSSVYSAGTRKATRRRSKRCGELEEETGLAFGAERFQPLVDFSVAYPAGGGVKGLYYVLRDVPITDVVVTEGTALVATRDELPALLPRMTPSACYVTRLFMMVPE